MIFIDSNIVITFFADSHPHHDRSHAFVIEELKKGTILAVSPQVIGETFRALTSPHATSTGAIHPSEPVGVGKTTIGKKLAEGGVL